MKNYFLIYITNYKGNILAFSSGTTHFHYLRLAFLDSSIKSVQERVYLVHTQANPTLLIVDLKPISTMKMAARCANYIRANLKLRKIFSNRLRELKSERNSPAQNIVQREFKYIEVLLSIFIKLRS